MLVVLITECVADALSQIEVNALYQPPIIDFKAITGAQQTDAEVSQLQSPCNILTSIITNAITNIRSDITLWYVYRRSSSPLCTTTILTDSVWFLTFTYALQHPCHSTSHHYVWPNINKDVWKWARCCIQCQKSKIQRHTIALLGTFNTPDVRFASIHIDIVGLLHPLKDTH